MEIETKFSIGDPIWIIQSGRAALVTIGSIHIFITGITYSFVDSQESRPENECFATKEELLKYVAGE